jgi:hypothetical protein
MASKSHRLFQGVVGGIEESQAHSSFHPRTSCEALAKVVKSKINFFHFLWIWKIAFDLSPQFGYFPIHNRTISRSKPMIGQRLSQYHITEKIGAGGMGEVYKARDTKLDRDVAIKVLPEAFAENKERLARFEREAKLLASLNHPNIATLFDLQEHEGTHFLVLELVPGETLAERIKRGAIPIDDALPLFMTTGADIWLLQEDGNRTTRQLLVTSFNEMSATFSPDSRWLAYGSDETGRSEIYVQSFLDAGGKRQVSTEGGAGPIWSRNGREIFYREGDKMMALAVETTPDFKAGTPQALFEGRYRKVIGPYPNYDVTPDGQRFVMFKLDEEFAPTQINVVLNWFEELERLVPRE